MADGSFANEHQFYRTVVKAEEAAFPFCAMMLPMWMSFVDEENDIRRIVDFYTQFTMCFEHEVVFKFINDLHAILTSLLIRGNSVMRHKFVKQFYKVNIH